MLGSMEYKHFYASYLKYDIGWVNMEKLIIEDNEKNKRMKSLAAFLGLFLIIFSIKLQTWWEIIIGVAFIYFSIYKKEIVVNEEGVFYSYKGIFLRHNESLDFSTISHVTICRAKDGSYLFYFIKGDLAKKLIVDEKYVKPIVKLIESRKEKISIEYEYLS